MRHEDDQAFLHSVGQRIRQLRLERRLSLREFGQLADIHPFHVMAIELGQLAANTRTLKNIATALGVSSADLLNTVHDELGFIIEQLRVNPRAMAVVRAATNRAIN